jgi:hypothetical protein
MGCVPLYENNNCHIKIRDLENHYWIDKYLVTISESKQTLAFFVN